MTQDKTEQTAKTGLVLEGGAMRGMFTAGVTDVMMENGIDFDGIIGVSAGATFGCNYKSRQPGRTIRYNLALCKDPRYCSFRSWMKTGDLYGADFCYRTLPEELDVFDQAAYNANPMAFYAVVTDIETGKPVYHRCDDAEDSLQWMRASASMPVFSKPVALADHLYLDGGISDSIPLKAFEAMGYHRNVVILTQPVDYIKKRNPYMPYLRMRYGRRYPHMVEDLKNRHTFYNRQRAYVRKEAAEGKAYVIMPDFPLKIGSVCHNPQDLRRVYSQGRVAGENHLEGLKAFLEK
ncbi:MAG: patatin family protein [Pseudoramibacter sp.]